MRCRLITPSPFPKVMRRWICRRAQCFIFRVPFERDEDFCTAIEVVAEAIAGYPLAQYGLELDADAAPRFNFGAGAKNGAKMALPVRQAKSADHI